MTEIVERVEDGVVVVELGGRVDSTNATELEDRLLALVDGGHRRMVVDCARLEYISSAGLRVLLIVAKRLAAADGTIALASLRGQIHEVIGIVGFDRVFRVLPTAAEAVAVVRGAAASGGA